MDNSLLRPWACSAMAGVALVAAPAQATTELAAAPEGQQRVRVEQHYDNAVGSSDAASQGVIRAELLRNRPAMRPGEVLEFVPGVIVTQHSGDGKANQYFLRGFNLDHGTDFATRLQGMPLNMPTHAHGQGYTDLNPLIPELVQRIEYRKGPYFARSGDFSLAGGADIGYRTRLDGPMGEVTLGARGFRRLLLGGSTDLGGGLQALAAAEVHGNDGPWTQAQNLRRRNGVLSVSRLNDQGDGWQAHLMAYDARWTATDQVPERLVESGAIGRFDSLDPTTGGKSSRHSLSFNAQDTDALGLWRANAYLTRYTLDLYSNFTYALERPDTGDQFAQRDQRTVSGVDLLRSVGHEWGGRDLRTEVGLQVRHDRIAVGLYDAQARRLLGTVREDAVRQTLAGVHVQTVVPWTPWLRTVAGLRADAMSAHVDARSDAANGGRASDSLLSPKLSVVLGPWRQTELFVNAGRGFHSNDVRGATITRDPRSGEPVPRVSLLVPGQGAELGMRTEAVRGLQSSLALWQLNTRSELVYVGDAGTTEASLGGRRRGVEFNNRWVPRPGLLVDADFAWTRSRFVDGTRIPNAVDRVASMAVTWRDLGPWSAGLNVRHLGPAALVEDNSIRSRPSSTLNLRASRRLWALSGPAGRERMAELVVDVFNLSNRRVDDIQYFYESRARFEATATAGRHVHPAEPRTLRVTLRMGI